ncbi:MAG: xanthine dehydrogenase family protein subunit M [Candidatus Cloacimonetes bacterium]|nr:xanthine dehydrogenase family protein subunit M [Candidatus Cloacimonadota bacterium]
MGIINDFEYKKPKNIKEALQLLAEKRGKSKILAGGTDLIVYLKEELLKTELVIDLKGIEELNNIKVEKDKVIIGAGVTFTELIESQEIQKKLPILWEACKKVASVGIRNRATLAGNICSAVPSIDSAPALLVYDAEIVVQNATEKKNVSIHNWFTGPKKTILASDEIVISINIPLSKHTGGYEKLGRYQGEDLAQAGIGILVDSVKNYRFASCAVGPVPKRLYKLEEYLQGKEINEEILAKAGDIISDEISPISDIRSSAEYRTHMMKVMFNRGFKKALTSMKGGRL